MYKKQYPSKFALVFCPVFDVSMIFFEDSSPGPAWGLVFGSLSGTRFSFASAAWLYAAYVCMCAVLNECVM